MGKSDYMIFWSLKWYKWTQHTIKSRPLISWGKDLILTGNLIERPRVREATFQNCLKVSHEGEREGTLFEDGEMEAEEAHLPRESASLEEELKQREFGMHT